MSKVLRLSASGSATSHALNLQLHKAYFVKFMQKVPKWWRGKWLNFPLNTKTIRVVAKVWVDIEATCLPADSSNTAPNCRHEEIVPIHFRLRRSHLSLPRHQSWSDYSQIKISKNFRHLFSNSVAFLEHTAASSYLPKCLRGIPLLFQASVYSGSISIALS